MMRSRRNVTNDRFLARILSDRANTSFPRHCRGSQRAWRSLVTHVMGADRTGRDGARPTDSHGTASRARPPDHGRAEAKLVPPQIRSVDLG